MCTSQVDDCHVTGEVCTTHASCAAARNGRCCPSGTSRCVLCAGSGDDVAGALPAVPAGEPWEPWPAPPLAAAPQSACVAPRTCGRAAWYRRRPQHAAWRSDAAREIVGRLRSHCATCEVTAQVIRAAHSVHACIWYIGTTLDMRGEWPRGSARFWCLCVLFRTHACVK